MNRQPESRVRENRMHGSEGGGTGYLTGPSYPYPPTCLLREEGLNV